MRPFGAEGAISTVEVIEELIQLDKDLDAATIAERRHMPAPAVAVCEIEQRVAGLERVRLAVNGGGDGGEVLDHDCEDLSRVRLSWKKRKDVRVNL